MRGHASHAAANPLVRQVPLHDYAALVPRDLEAIADRLAAHRTLAEVLRWAAAQSPPLAIAEIVTQDEYTHDVVLPLDASRPLWLAYDTT